MIYSDKNISFATVKASLVVLAVFALGFFNGFVGGYYGAKDKYTTEVKDVVNQLKAENKKLSDTINELNKEKDVEIDKVKTLNNDSTIILFYDLLK